MTRVLRMRWLAVVLAGLCVMAVAPGGTGYAAASRGAARDDLVATVPAGPAPLAATGTLTGVACVSAASCVAVGHSFAQFFNNVAGQSLAERWNGRRWTTLVSPGRLMFAVACPRARLCQAVGGGSAERWDGRAWILEKTPAVRKADLVGVACPAASACVAVGTRPIGRSNVAPLAETWNGSAWAVHNPVSRGASSNLSWVSCARRSFCVAVGYYQQGASQATLAESWNGRRWTRLTLPPTGTDARLTGVSCVSAKNCIAVGFANFENLTESWNGTRWTVRPAAPSFARTISCAAAANCTAIGENGGEPAAMSWNGRSWKTLSLPPSVPAKLSALTLTAVSCPAAKSCMAVGGSNDGSFSMSWNGSAWQGLRVNRADELSGISCTTAPRCMATGSFVTASGKLVALTESWNGLSWRREPASQAAESVLADVSCASAGRCVAVGAIGDSANLAEAWDGTAWRVTPAPPPSFPTGLNTVSCRGVTCLAIELFFQDAWVWNGASWGRIPSPQNGGVNDVSCVRPAYCMGVGGEVINPDDPAFAVAALWNGANWQQLTPPDSDALNTVSCTSTTFCMAAGFNFADIWNGTSWRMLKLPGSFGIGGPGTIYGGLGITGISCASSFACMAVGNYLIRVGSQYEGVNVAEYWNGTRWRRLPTPGPGGGLTDVSCTSASRCMAVGLSPAQPAGTHLLTERWNGKRWLQVATPNP